jgi:hypothetical protein
MLMDLLSRRCVSERGVRFHEFMADARACPRFRRSIKNGEAITWSIHPAAGAIAEES